MESLPRDQVRPEVIWQMIVFMANTHQPVEIKRKDRPHSGEDIVWGVHGNTIFLSGKQIAELRRFLSDDYVASTIIKLIYQNYHSILYFERRDFGLVQVSIRVHNLHQTSLGWLAENSLPPATQHA